MIDDRTRDLLLRRIGLDDVPPVDAGGLRMVHRAFVSRVPYEDLAVQLGEFEELDSEALVARMLRGGRGGYCFEANTVLQTLLEALGFSVVRHQGIVGARDARLHAEPTNHMALVAHTPDGSAFIVDAGLGEGSLDPLPLAEGTVTAGAFQFTIEREPDGWWVSQHKFGSIPGFWFGDEQATLADFQPHHRRLSTTPESSFVQTLVVQLPSDEEIVTLRARTLFVDGPGSGERHLIDDREAFGLVLSQRFGIDPAGLGAERLGRLWTKSGEQHRAHQR